MTSTPPRTFPTAWELKSNSGSERIRWDVRSANGAGDSLTLVCDLSVRASSWRSGSNPGDVDLTIHELYVRGGSLDLLERHLRAWVELPLAELARTPLEYSTDAGGVFDSGVRLGFGPRADLIASHHPCVTLRYDVGRLAVEFSFVTDQTCIRELCDGIRDGLATLDSAR